MEDYEWMNNLWTNVAMCFLEGCQGQTTFTTNTSLVINLQGTLLVIHKDRC